MGIVTIDGIPVYQALVTDDECGMLRISLVDEPAVQSNFLAFAKERPVQMYAVQDEEKRLVLGVVMRADFPIYRRDEKAGEYYIIYKADTIRKMAEKYLVENRQNAVDLMHDGQEVGGVQMVQYFIKGKGLSPEGFDDIADGSLFAEFHITDDGIWEAVKAGTYKGFSLEGVFDLAPETDKPLVEEIVDALDGVFSRIFKHSKQYKEMKMKGLLARLAKALVEMGNVTTDKGVLAWDGDEDLKEGDSVFIEDENGERTPAADGDYTTGDAKVIVVVEGKVSEIKDAEAEVAPQPEAEEEAEEEPVKAQAVATDKGNLEWDGEEDLKAGDAVYTLDEEGNRVAAADGDYTTEDGKVISVVDGKVSEIRDDKAEVAARKEQAMSRRQKFEESYDEKFRRIADAVAAVREDEFYIADAGDDFAVVCAWGEDYVDHYFRYPVSWNEDGSASVAEPVEVKSMFVPLDFVSPFEKEPVSEEEMASVKGERDAALAKVAELEAQVAKLSVEPKGSPAHIEHERTLPQTGNKGLDNLSRLMSAK